MTLTTSSYPLQKSVRGGGSRRAGSVRLAIKSRMEVLAGVPLFAELPKRQLHSIAQACRTRRWPSGLCVVPENTKAQVCYVIVEGTVDVSTKGRTIARLGPGDFFGEIALLDPGPRTASVPTTTEMVAVELSRQSFLSVARDNPTVLLAMLETLAKRLREATQKSTD